MVDRWCKVAAFIDVIYTDGEKVGVWRHVDVTDVHSKRKVTALLIVKLFTDPETSWAKIHC